MQEKRMRDIQSEGNRKTFHCAGNAVRLAHMRKISDILHQYFPDTSGKECQKIEGKKCT